MRTILHLRRLSCQTNRKWRRKRVVWVITPEAGIRGQLMENQLPTFWRDSLSHLFGDTRVKLDKGTGESVDRSSEKGAAVGQRRGRKTPTEVKRAKAREMRQSGYSYGEIADALGIARSYAYKLVKGSG